MKRSPTPRLHAMVLALLVAAGIACFSERDADKNQETPHARTLAKRWAEFSGGRRGKVVFARPPRMICLDLAAGLEREVPGVEVAGAAGRKARGRSPRPFWAPDGARFVYRFRNRVYVCEENGRKQAVANARMDCSDETRWSWHRRDSEDWLAGPSIDGDVILVKVSDPSFVRTVYDGGDVEKHCEITGSGRFVVIDDGRSVSVAPFGEKGKRIRISRGRSCRPCAAPDDRVAWLPSSHDRYRIFEAATGRFLADLLAPPREEIYRLNWSNLSDYAVHMYGSGGNTRMHVRKIGSGEFLFIGCGWDPDLWVGPDREK